MIVLLITNLAIHYRQFTLRCLTSASEMGFLILLLILLLVITNLPLIGDACVFTKVLSHLILILILTFVHARPVLLY